MLEALEHENQDQRSERYLVVRSREEFDALAPADETTPIVIVDSPASQMYPTAELAARLRARTIRNPLVYFSPIRAVNPREKAAFLDAGGDSIVDLGDVAHGELPARLLESIVRSLNRTAQQRLQAKERIEYPFGISLDAHNRDIYINGVRLTHLTPYEFRILEAYLQLRPTQGEGYVSYELLRTMAYHDTVETGRNSLKSLISKMNHKLGPHGIALKGQRGYGNQGYALQKLKR